MDFLEFLRVQEEKSIPQGLKASGFQAEVSGLKPGPTQHEFFSQLVKSCPANTKNCGNATYSQRYR
jgi:hypothetical protein